MQWSIKKIKLIHTRSSTYENQKNSKTSHLITHRPLKIQTSRVEPFNFRFYDLFYSFFNFEQLYFLWKYRKSILSIIASYIYFSIFTAYKLESKITNVGISQKTFSTTKSSHFVPRNVTNYLKINHILVYRRKKTSITEF